MVTPLNEDSFIEKVFDYEHNKEWSFKGSRPAILEFFVTWCPHCKAMAPRYEELSDELKGKVDCYKVDLELHPTLAKLFNVTSFPTFLFFQKNKRPEVSVGEMPTADLRRLVKQEFGL